MTSRQVNECFSHITSHKLPEDPRICNSVLIGDEKPRQKEIAYGHEETWSPQADTKDLTVSQICQDCIVLLMLASSRVDT